MSKFLCLFLIVLLSSCSVYTDDKKSVVYHPTEAVLLGAGIAKVVILQDTKLLVQVPSNPSTGYRWVLTLPPKFANCFKVLNNGSFIKDRSGTQGIIQIGAPGLQEWEIQANCAGVYVLQWNNIRPWEKEQLPIKTYQIRLEIPPA